MPPATEQISIADLQDLTVAALLGLGIVQSEARQIADVLLYAELRGNSQGLEKILERSVVAPEGHGATEVAARSGATLRLDANQSNGMAAAALAANEAVSLAFANGIGLVGLMNFSTSTGAIGYYAERIANSGQIGIVLAGSPKVMAMTSGIDPVFGTNPIAIAAPTSGEPLLLDMATAAIAWFDIVTAKRLGDTIPEGVAIDKAGKPTTDAAEAMAGALLAFGGHKGAGLALMVEALTGPLTGAGVVGDDDAASNRGCSFIAIDPGTLTSGEQFTAAMDRMAERIRMGRRADTDRPVTLPGDRSRARRDANLKAGHLVLDSTVLAELRKLARACR